MRDLFFDQCQHGPRKWLCICDTMRCVTGTGYTGLVNHLREKQIDEYSVALGVAVAQSSSRDSSLSHEANREAFLWNPSIVRMHGWLQLIIHNLFPFSASQNRYVHCHVRYDPISLILLMTYVGLLTFSVEKKIASALPDTFVIVINDITEADSNYLCVCANFSADNKIGFESILLGFTPLSEDD